jgi:hypothetical protein
VSRIALVRLCKLLFVFELQFASVLDLLDPHARYTWLAQIRSG